MRRLIFFLIVLLAQFSFSQSYNFGDISEEELKEPIFAKFPESNSSVLYRKEFICFEATEKGDLTQKTEIHERVKIYNKTGFEQAAKLIDLFNNKNVLDLNGVIYNLIENKVVTGAIKKDSIIETFNNLKQTTFKFIFPKLKEGCIIEYKYVLKKDCCSKSSVVLQKDIPIKKLDVEIRKPRSLNYQATFNPKSLISHQIQRSVDVANSKSNLKEANTNNDGNNYDYEEVITISDTDIPPFLNEPFAINDSYISKLILQPENQVSKIRNLANSEWEEVSRAIYNNPEFEGLLRDPELFKDDLESVISGSETNREKAVILFNFIKLKMNWNELEGITPINGFQKAYEEGIGNVAEINLTLISMLRSLGLEAYPILIRTTSNEVLNPSPSEFNYVVCQVKLGDEILLLDATDRFSSPNILPFRTLKGKGRLIKDDFTSEWIDLMTKKTSTKKITLNARLQKDKSFRGHVKIQYADYQAYSYRNQFRTKSEKEIIKSIKKGNLGLSLYDFKLKSENDFLNTINQSFDFKSTSSLKKIGNRVHFSPLLFIDREENPFIDPIRQYPINFVYPFENEYNINIIIPEGYELEAFPQNEIINYNGNDGQFSYYARESGKMLQFIITLKLNKTLVLPEDYQNIKLFYKSIFDKKMERVILREVEPKHKRRSGNSR